MARALSLHLLHRLNLPFDTFKLIAHALNADAFPRRHSREHRRKACRANRARKQGATGATGASRGFLVGCSYVAERNHVVNVRGSGCCLSRW